MPVVDWWSRWRRRRATGAWLIWLLDQGGTWPRPWTREELRTAVWVDKQQRHDDDYGFADNRAEQRTVWLLRLDVRLRDGREFSLWEVDRHAQMVDRRDNGAVVGLRKTVDDMAFHASHAVAQEMFARGLEWAASIGGARRLGALEKRLAMDPITLVVGAAIFGVGIVVGRVLRFRAHPKPPKPRCSCQHPRSMHDKDGRCHEQEIVTLWDIASQDDLQKLVPCACQQYDGPQPLPEFYAPEITSQ